MALDFLNESASDTAEANAMRAETIAPNPEPAAPAPAAAPAEPAKPAEPPKAAEPAPAETPKPAEPAVKRDGAPVGFVPNAALKEAREANQKLQRELADLRAGKPPAVAEPPNEIDLEADPLAALREVREFQQQQREEAQQRQQITAFSNRIQQHEADWAASDPDYADKVAFLRQSRHDELEMLGFSNEDIGRQLTIEALQTADIAFKAGKNPGEVFATLAAKRGWKAKDAAAPAAPVAPAAPAGPDPAIEQRRVESEAALERISRGQKASRATAGGGGNEPAEDMTLERLSTLNGEVFDRAMDKHGKRLFGGG